MRKEQTETKRVALAPAAWEKWILSLDKYIDPNDQSKKRRYSLLTGLILCLMFYLLMLYMGLPNESALALLVGVFLIEIVLLGMDEAAWRTDRRFQHMNDKSPVGCNCNNLRSFPEKGWLRSRLIEHYTCTVYEVRSSVFMGWLIATTLLLLLNWWFTFFE